MKLKDMTLEELWALFPIVLTNHDPHWLDRATEEIALLSKLLAGFDPVITHIGSTAIPMIKAKPIVDILVEIPSDTDRKVLKEIMESNGYICMSEKEECLSFNKGYTPAGYAEKVFHIHFRRLGDNDEILFRNYLIGHAEIAKEYEQLKIALSKEYKNDRDSYTAAKTDFIKNIVERARQL